MWANDLVKKKKLEQKRQELNQGVEQKNENLNKAQTSTLECHTLLTTYKEKRKKLSLEKKEIEKIQLEKPSQENKQRKEKIEKQLTALNLAIQKLEQHETKADKIIGKEEKNIAKLEQKIQKMEVSSSSDEEEYTSLVGQSN